MQGLLKSRWIPRDLADDPAKDTEEEDVINSDGVASSVRVAGIRDWHKDALRIRMFFPGVDPSLWTLYQFIDALARISSLEFPAVLALTPERSSEGKA